MSKSKKSLGYWVTLVLLLLGSLGVYALSRRTKNGANQTAPFNNPNEVTQLILNAVQNSGYSYRIAQYWVYVSKMETAKWTSNLFLKNHNLWGMKTPQKRQTTATNKGMPDTWAKYANVAESAKDIVYYMIEFNYPTSVDSLEDFISIMQSKGYFGNESFESYYNKVLAWIER